MPIGEKRKDRNTVSTGMVQPIQYISFSFKYLTDNNRYSFAYFKSDLRNSHTAYEAFLQKCKQLCEGNTTDAKLNGKEIGCEPIPYKRFARPVQQIYDNIEIIDKDSKLMVFRFYQNNYRMICKPDTNHPNLLYVIAFDFDYSAYDHG